MQTQAFLNAINRARCSVRLVAAIQHTRALHSGVDYTCFAQQRQAQRLMVIQHRQFFNRGKKEETKEPAKETPKEPAKE